MTGDHFRRRVAELVRRVGSQIALARKSGLSDRAVRDYLAGNSKPKGENALRLAEAAGVRLHWFLTGEGPMEERAGAVESPKATYEVVNLKILAAAIEAVDSRMPLVAPAGKARVAAACYDYLLSHGQSDAASLSGFLDLITMPNNRALAAPYSEAIADDQLLEEKPPRQRTKK